ncbi:MAG: methyltransferase domain-containing protein [Clostridiales bacterium]|nr:methyltransferase domain-containing protein [Clostridiales bacterium]
MINWFYDCYQILNKVYGEGAFIKQAISSSFIEEKNRALTIKTCYGVLDKDIELSYYLKYLAPKTPKLAIRTILKVAFYALKYLNKKPYAVTENAVELTKKLGKAGAGGFVNATLRKFIKTEFILPSDVAENLSIKYSYPLFAVNELLEFYGKEKTEKIISATNEKTCLSFYEESGEEYLKNKGVNYEKTPFDNVFYAQNFIRNEDYDRGIYTYQALGSVAICEGVSGGENLLDCCSAPGGKAIRLSHKFKQVTAWDIHPHRVELINDYAKRMKRDNITASVQDAKEYNSEYKEKFDAVLCDAPCSGLGVVNDNPDIKLNREISNVIELTKEQLAILKNVASYVKVGGYLYYSTCSVLPRENIETVKKFISLDNRFEVVETDSLLPHEKQQKTLQFLPDISGGLGFYFAKLKRIK